MHLADPHPTASALRLPRDPVAPRSLRKSPWIKETSLLFPGRGDQGTYKPAHASYPPPADIKSLWDGNKDDAAGALEISADMPLTCCVIRKENVA
jgi:hypothetical protein